MQLTETLLFHFTSPPQLPVSHNSHVTASQMSLYRDDVIFWTLHPHYWWLSIELILSECTNSHLYVSVSRYFLKRMTGYLVFSTFLCIHEVLLRRFLNISVYFVCHNVAWKYCDIILRLCRPARAKAEEQNVNSPTLSLRYQRLYIFYSCDFWRMKVTE